MVFIYCEVTDGSRAGFKTVGVNSVEGWREYFSIEEKFLKPHNGNLLLPVRVIGVDRQQNLTLIQLPAEADSGASRVWVSKDTLVTNKDEVAAAIGIVIVSCRYFGIPIPDVVLKIVGICLIAALVIIAIRFLVSL